MFSFRETTPLRKLLMLKAMTGSESLVEATATPGNPCTFETDVAKALTQCKVNFTPVQSGSGDPSPTNVRPITGWTGLRIWQYPENKLNITRSEGQDSNGVTFTPIKDGNNVVRSVRIKGEKTGANVFYNLNYAVGTLSFPVGSYKVSGYSSICSFRVYAIKNGSETKIYDSASQSEFTVTSEMTQVWMRIQVTGDVGQVVDETVYPIVISSDATLNTIPVVFPAEAGTVYGGNLDLTTGVLTVDWKMFALNDADSWVDGATYFSYTGHDRGDRKTGESYSLVCSAFPAAQKSSGTAYIRWGGATAYNILLAPNGSGLTISDVKSMATNGDIVIAYPLATPQTYQLTAQQITALVGDNVLWSDANGNLEVKYMKKG